MAEVRRTSELKEVTKTVTVSESVVEYHLTLNETEAKLVTALVGRVNGNQEKPYRQAAGEIYGVLYTYFGFGVPQLVDRDGKSAEYRIDGEQSQ